MLILKTNPVGVDFTVQRYQSYMYYEIAKLYPGCLHESFGRCTRQKKNGQYVAEVYNSISEFADPLWDDSKDIVSFYGISDIQDVIHQKVAIHLVVFCNLATLKPNVAHRADEEVRIDFLKLAGKCTYQFHYTGLELTLDKILKEYKGSIANLGNVDTGPVHAFRINFLVNYNPKQTPLKLN